MGTQASHNLGRFGIKISYSAEAGRGREDEREGGGRGTLVLKGGEKKLLRTEILYHQVRIGS